MGNVCACSGDEQYDAATTSQISLAPMTPMEKRLVNQQVKDDFDRDTSEQNESTAQEVVNELMRSILPSVRFAIGKAVAGWTKKGLPFDGGQLSVLNELDPKGILDPRDVVDRLLVRMEHVLIHRTVALPADSTHSVATHPRCSSTPSASAATPRAPAQSPEVVVGSSAQEQSAAIRVQKMIRGKEARDQAGAVVIEREMSRFRMRLPGEAPERAVEEDEFDRLFEGLTDGAMRNPQAITLDAALTLKLSFSKRSKLYFKIKLDLLFGPSFSFRVKWFKLQAKVRCENVVIPCALGCGPRSSILDPRFPVCMGQTPCEVCMRPGSCVALVPARPDLRREWVEVGDAWQDRRREMIGEAGKVKRGK